MRDRPTDFWADQEVRKLIDRLALGGGVQGGSPAGSGWGRAPAGVSPFVCLTKFFLHFVRISIFNSLTIHSNPRPLPLFCSFRRCLTGPLLSPTSTVSFREVSR